MFANVAWLVFLIGFTAEEIAPNEEAICVLRKCEDKSELLCVRFKDYYLMMVGYCEVKAHYCSTREKYEIAPIEECPRISACYPRTFDPICITTGRETYQMFKNYCEFKRFELLAPTRYSVVPLEDCGKYLDMPGVCASVDQIVKKIVCSYDGNNYVVYYLHEYYKIKCRANGNLRIVSMIYCRV